jgi:uncharacterized membrane protein
MASSRTAAQRRRARAMARQSSRPRSPAPAPAEAAGGELEGGATGPGWYVPPRRWPTIAGVVLCVLGLGVAAYLTYAHYDPTVTLACPDHGVVNCEAVTTSAYSSIVGVPVALLGLVFFAGMLPLQLPPAWRSALPWVRVGRMAGAAIGVGTVIWLVYAELFLVGKICLYCTSVHVLTFLLFATTLFGTISTTPEPAAPEPA